MPKLWSERLVERSQQNFIRARRHFHIGLRLLVAALFALAVLKVITESGPYVNNFLETLLIPVYIVAAASPIIILAVLIAFLNAFIHFVFRGCIPIILENPSKKGNRFKIRLGIELSLLGVLFVIYFWLRFM